MSNSTVDVYLSFKRLCMLKILHQASYDPYFNIATEEHLLKNKTDDFFILYRNSPCLVVGKHQNTAAEINHQFVEVNRIPVVRRLSGGGTVYHDLGNINFSFIMNGAEGQLVDFKRYTEPIIGILQGFGVDAFLGKKNDIRVGDKKISGNAEHIFRNRVLHHGTLLFNSDIDKLDESIKVDLSKYRDNAVKSIRSSVANIVDFLSAPISVDFFMEVLVGYMQNNFQQSQEFILSPADVEGIEGLVRSKYSTWEWNYGYSPAYEVENRIQTPRGELLIKVKVVRGFVDNVEFDNGPVSLPYAAKLKTLLIGKPHSKDSIANALADKKIGDLFLSHLSVQIMPEYFY